MKKYSIFMAGVLCAAIVICTGAKVTGNNVSKAEKAEINMEKNVSSESKGKPLFQADLTHDGLMETVEADVEKAKSDSQALINITVKNLDKKVIWEEEIALPHLSQGAYYICRKEEKDFLLYYLPSDTQGLFSYQYKLFYFNEDGEVLLQDEEKLTFVKDESKGVKLPVEKMVSFAEKLNAYMKNSYLLVSTLDGELLYSTEYEKETYTETYQRFLNADEQQDLRSGLKAYQKRINNQVIGKAEEELISDTFYIEHKENCKTTDWTFMAKKEVLRYKDPQTEKKLDKAICQGENVRIQRIYQTASEKWGLLFWSRDAKGNITNTTGWVKLSDLEFVYDTHAFYMDHKEELELVSDIENLSFEEIRSKLNQEVVLWSYPCSGEIVCRISAEKYPTDNRIQSGLVYQDDEKRYWLLIPSGTDSVGTKWSGYSICLSDPANEKISAKKIEPFTTPDGDETGNTKYVFCAVCMVCCMCVVGACAVIYRKRHKK